jgi:tetratricopeptide (TPR) repeat protein
MGETEKSKGSGKLPDFDRLWDYAHPDLSERRFRELLPVAVDSLDMSYLAQLLTQVARAEGLQRKFQDANRTLDRVERALPRTDGRTLIRYLLERGRVCNSSGNLEDAKRLFVQAYDLAVKSKEEFLAVDAAHMVAIAESPESRLEWNLKSLDLAENSADERVRTWKGSLYNNIGWTYFDQGDYQEALFMFEKELDYRMQQADSAGVGVAKWCVAKTLRMMGHTEEALEMQQQLFEEYQSAGRRNGFVYEEIGECLLNVARELEAEGWFAAAYNELSKDPSVANDRERLLRLKTLGKVGMPQRA